MPAPHSPWAVNFVPSDVEAIDSIIVYGIPEPITRSAIAMPARGGKSDLSTDECLAAAAYVWVISQVQGEPWPGGHRTHVEPGSGSGADRNGRRPSPGSRRCAAMIHGVADDSSPSRGRRLS